MTQSGRALITGAAGFLGSHIADKLLDAGFDVVGVDDFSTSSSRSAHHRSLTQRPRYSFVNANVAEPGELERCVGRDFTVIYNMACPASPPAYQRMPMHTLMTSVIGAASCVAIAARSGARLVHASTSEIYGDPEVSPQPETYWGRVNSWGPRACYDEGKRAAEAIMWIAKRDGVDVRVARIFNTYGPRMQIGDGRVVTEFVKSLLAMKPLLVHGDGSQTRSLCYCSDLVAGLLALGLAPRSPDSPVNIGNQREVTISELASIIQDVTGRHVGMMLVGRPIDDPSNRRPDVSEAKALLGWEPKVSLEDGLLATFKWFEAQQCD